jgi:hypothetical protein
MLLPALEADLVLDGCGRHWGGAMIARHYNPANSYDVFYKKLIKACH